jgi:hypothetical protein
MHGLRTLHVFSLIFGIAFLCTVRVLQKTFLSKTFLKIPKNQTKIVPHPQGMHCEAGSAMLLIILTQLLSDG